MLATRHGRSPLFWLVSVLIVISLIYPCKAVGDSRDWVRGFMDSPRGQNTPPVRCKMLTVTSTNGHLTGDLLFINESLARIDLEGEKRQDGTFWPRFIAQVKNEDQADWRTIGESEKPQNLVTSAVEPLSEQKIYVNMNMFRPAIGKVMYGRIVFPNGTWTMFDLELFVH